MWSLWAVRPTVEQWYRAMREDFCGTEHAMVWVLAPREVGHGLYR